MKMACACEVARTLRSFFLKFLSLSTCHTLARYQVSLGDKMAGLWSDNEELSAALAASSAASGDKLWRMPMGKEEYNVSLVERRIELEKDWQEVVRGRDVRMRRSSQNNSGDLSPVVLSLRSHLYFFLTHPCTTNRSAASRKSPT